MKKRNILALALMMGAVATAVGVTSFDSEAKTITMVQDGSLATYRTLTEDQRAVIAQLFDADYYAATNFDVVETFGSDYDSLFNHFCDCGIWEGRKGWPEFDPSAYASAYPDLREAFGDDVLAYYMHYYNNGIAEKRYITTVEKCEALGIKVVSLFPDWKFLDTEIYMGAKLIGTGNYEAVNQAANTAATQGAAALADDDGEVILFADAMARIQNENLEPIGTITVGGKPIIIYVTKTSTGYNAYTSESNAVSCEVTPNENGTNKRVYTLPDDIVLVNTLTGNPDEVGTYDRTIYLGAINYTEDETQRVSEEEPHIGQSNWAQYSEPVHEGEYSVVTSQWRPYGTFGWGSTRCESTEPVGNVHTDPVKPEGTNDAVVNTIRCDVFSYDENAEVGTTYDCVIGVDNSTGAVTVGAYSEEDQYAIISTYQR